MSGYAIAFGAFVIDPLRETLLRHGQNVVVSQRGIFLLHALIEADGQAVSKNDLMQCAWPGMIVEEGNLTVQISALRKALGTSDDGNDWIVTVPRVGYRLLQLQNRASAAIEHSVLPSLAVLPFQNLSADPEQDYFADGIVEDIITALSRFKSFAVIARNSTLVYKGRNLDVRQVASELGIKYVLTGSVRRLGERLRIAAQLIDGNTGSQLWAENFDGQQQDVFAFQESITESVAFVVEPQIQKAELENAKLTRSGSVAAYDIFLQARAAHDAESKEDNARAAALLQEVIKLEPENALAIAYSGYALEHAATMGWSERDPDFRERCISIARRGLQLAHGDAMVIMLSAMTLIYGGKEFDWGMAATEAALEANANNIDVVVRAGVAHLNCGDLDMAQTYCQRALQLSPRDPNRFLPLTCLAHVAITRGKYGEALDLASRALSLNPIFGYTLWILTAANAHLGRMVEAQRFLDDACLRAPGLTISKISDAIPRKFPDRLNPILQGLRLAGLPEG